MVDQERILVVPGEIHGAATLQYPVLLSTKGYFALHVSPVEGHGAHIGIGIIVGVGSTQQIVIGAGSAIQKDQLFGTVKCSGRANGDGSYLVRPGTHDPGFHGTVGIEMSLDLAIQLCAATTPILLPKCVPHISTAGVAFAHIPIEVLSVRGIGIAAKIDAVREAAASIADSDGVYCAG